MGDQRVPEGTDGTRSDSFDSDSTDSDGSAARSPAADPPRGDGDPALSPAARSSLLWGVVGGLSFLVLVQGYDLLTEQSVDFGVKLVVALAVAAGSAGLTHLFRGRLSRGDR